jgi:hypothetical protein
LLFQKAVSGSQLELEDDPSIGTSLYFFTSLHISPPLDELLDVPELDPLDDHQVEELELHQFDEELVDPFELDPFDELLVVDPPQVELVEELLHPLIVRRTLSKNNQSSRAATYIVCFP